MVYPERDNMEKILHVDWNSYASIQKAILMLKSRRGELNPNPLGSRKERNFKIFNACTKIWNSDILHVYRDLVLDTKTSDYYVYAHCDPRRKIAVNFEGKTSFLATLGAVFQPVYIGKGRGERCYDLNRNGAHRKFRQNLKDFGLDLIVIKLKENLTEIEALSYESKLIDILGVQGKGGKLLNLDEGVNHKQRRNVYRKEYLCVSKIAQEKSKINGDDMVST